MTMSIKDMVLKLREKLDEKKAIDIEIIEIGERTVIADYMVLASASNERLLGAIANEAEDVMQEIGILPKGIEGKKEAGWILLDFGDIIVNVLTVEMREKYNIEKVWMDCPKVE